MAETSIEWATEVWNPFTGCDRVSPGCAHCYAATSAARLQRQEKGRIAKARAEGKPDPKTRYQKDGHPLSSGPGFGFTVHWDKLENPPRFKPGARVFVNSMSDVFHEEAPVGAIADMWDVFADRPDVEFLVLTKRPERMFKLLTGWDAVDRCENFPPIGPLPNVWLGVTIENRKFVHRADILRNTPAAVRFISAEPLLGPLLHHHEHRWGLVSDEDPNETEVCGECGRQRDRGGILRERAFITGGWPNAEIDLNGIDWVIVGGESGADYRPFDVEWARVLYEESRQTGTAFFFKQMGGVRPGGELEKLPSGLRVREFPQRESGVQA
jgi:protein gp37